MLDIVYPAQVTPLASILTLHCSFRLSSSDMCIVSLGIFKWNKLKKVCTLRSVALSL